MKVDVLGVKIDALKKTEVLDKISTLLNEDPSTSLRAGKPVFIVTPYSETMVAAQKDEEFRKILNAADIALADGVGILWTAKYLELRIKNKELRIWALVKTLSTIIFNPKYIRSPIPEKISGSEFVWDLAGLAAEKNYSVFLLGGFGDTPEIAAKKLQEKFTDLRIAGVNDFTPSSNDGKGRGEVAKINSSGADFLFVALGPIRQEKWIYENLPKLRVKLAIGLGGTFDYIAQKRPYRPKIWATRGLEWLWRLATQPWRLGRIIKGVFGLIYYAFRFEPK
jgi:N-acetylglucosaminyldiphosphoundecaprenol N-acetyl-beta-D-mannosaminyltransferase